MSTPITSELIARTGAALGEGGWRYTPRQLYYASCAAAESPWRSPARAELAAGVLLGLVALVLLPFRPVSLAVGTLAVLALGLGAVSRLTRKPPAGRVLGVSYVEFQALLRDTPPLPGLMREAAGGSDVARAALDGAGVVAVCDTAENAAAVRANFDAAGIGPIPVLTLDGAQVAGRTAVALHDASPRGCALPLELVDAGVRVIDAGLRPGWVDRTDVQVLEGAPARMPRDLASVLGEAELDWLRSGRRVELAVLGPERLMRLLQAAIERAATLPPESGAPAILAAASAAPAVLEAVSAGLP